MLACNGQYLLHLRLIVDLHNKFWVKPIKAGVCAVCERSDWVSELSLLWDELAYLLHESLIASVIYPHAVHILVLSYVIK